MRSWQGRQAPFEARSFCEHTFAAAAYPCLNRSVLWSTRQIKSQMSADEWTAGPSPYPEGVPEHILHELSPRWFAACISSMGPHRARSPQHTTCSEVLSQSIVHGTSHGFLTYRTALINPCASLPTKSATTMSQHAIDVWLHMYNSAWAGWACLHRIVLLASRICCSSSCLGSRLGSFLPLRLALRGGRITEDWQADSTRQLLHCCNGIC